MEFCEKCGKLLKIEKELAKCDCGFTKKINLFSITEKIQGPEQKGESIAEEKNEDNGFPHTCKKCGHKYADFADLGISYSDEANIVLFKCKKCKHVERDAFGSSNN